MKTTKTTAEIRKMSLHFVIDAKGLTFDEQTGKSEMQVLPTGSWNHPVYGPMTITAEDVTGFKKNFDAGLRNDIPITEGHECMDEKPAVGWFSELIDKGEAGLWAIVEWTEQGKQLLSSKAYKYFSPEFCLDYEDPQTREIYRDVLVGGALTNKPYFKEMEAVVMSEKTPKHNPSKFKEPTMLTADIVKKNAADLNDEEKAHLKANKAELSAEDQEKFKDVVAEPAATAPAPTEPEKKTAAEPKMIQMSEVEANELKRKANLGFEASEKLRKSEIAAEVDKMIFSEASGNGHFLPKSKDKLVALMSELTEAQRKAFSEIVADLPKAATKVARMFREEGAGGGNATSASALDVKVKAMMGESNGKMKYSDALKKVLAAEPELAASYEKEHPAGNAS